MSDRFKMWLAWVLVGLLLASTSATTFWLYEEGSATCERLVSNLPTDQRRRPCELLYRQSEDGPTYRRVKLQWDDRTLRRAVFVSEGESRSDISCSVVGRILLPLTHFRQWLTLSVLEELGGGDNAWKAIDTWTESRPRGDRRVRGIDGDGDGEIDRVHSKTTRSLDSGEIATHRYALPESGEMFRHVEITRNREGLVIARSILKARSGGAGHIDYRYSCAD